MDFKKLYINGEWIDSDSQDFIEVENPSNREIIAKVPRSNEVDVNRGIKGARKAYKSWRDTSLEYRIDLMEKLRIKLKENSEVLGRVIEKELGAPYKFAKKVHVDAYIEDMKSYIDIARNYEYEKDYGQFIVRREAFGVVGALTPWNYPFGQITKKITPALLAGNTVVLKPSQQTPLVAYYLTKYIDEVGFPKGVFNLIPGKGSEVGNIIATHKDIDMVSFTGSTVGGIEVGKLGLDSVKKLMLELGGKSATILLEGADLDLAFKVIFGSIFSNTGQSCSALSRLFVPKSMKKEVEEYIVKDIGRLKFGNPLIEDVDIGPLGSEKQFEKVKSYIELGLEEGAEILVGEVPKTCEEGYYVGPVVFTNVENTMRIAREEIFGPVLSIIEYEDVEEAIDMANDNIYGLSGAVFGPREEALEVARKLETGTVIVNDGKRTQSAPFGGYKQSGIGREGSIEGFEEFLEIKTIFS